MSQPTNEYEHDFISARNIIKFNICVTNVYKGCFFAFFSRIFFNARVDAKPILILTWSNYSDFILAQIFSVLTTYSRLEASTSIVTYCIFANIFCLFDLTLAFLSFCNLMTILNLLDMILNFSQKGQVPRTSRRINPVINA